MSVKFAVLGHGVVGSGVVELFYKNKKSIEKRAGTEMDIKYILDLRDFPAEIVTGAEPSGTIIVVAANPLPSGFVNAAATGFPIIAVPLSGTLPESQFAPSLRLPSDPPIQTWSLTSAK